MSLRSKIYGLIALFAFPFMILGGVTMITSDTVDCSGETMQAGDTCVTVDNGETTAERDYSEQKDDNTAFGWFLLAASLVAGGWGAITIRMIVIERKDKQQQQLGGLPQPGPGQQPGQYAPQPGQQQQWPQQPGYAPNPQQMQQPYQPPQGQPGPR